MHPSSVIGAILGGICGTALVWLNQPRLPGPEALRALMPAMGPDTTERLARPERALVRRQAQPTKPAERPPLPDHLSVTEIRERYGRSTAGERFNMLQRLVASGEPDAIDLLLEIIEHDPDSVGGSLSIWMLLQNVDDPRIYPLARRRVDELLERGLRGPHISGYLNLLGSHGGREGAETLLAHIRDAHGGISSEAARAVAHIRDHSLAQDYLHLVKDARVRSAHRIASGLAAWRDPGVSRDLIALGTDRLVSWDLRARTLEHVARYASEESDIIDLVGSYWSAGGDEHECRVAFSALAGLWQNRTADRAFITDRVAEVLADSLASDQWRHGG